MDYLIMQMVFCLLAAGLLGLFLGWLLFGGRSSDETRVKKLEADLGAARKDCDACVDARSDLEKQLTAALAERDTARAEAESVAMTDASGNTSTIVGLEDRIAELEGQLNASGEQSSRITELEAALAAATAAGMGAAVGAATSSGEDDDLRRELDDHKRRLSDVTLDRDNARARLAAQEARMLALKTDAEGARADLADAVRHQGSLSSTNEELQTQINALRARLDHEDTAALRARITELETALTAAPTIDEDANNDATAALQDRIAELEARLTSAPTTVDDQSGRISELEAALAAATATAAVSGGGDASARLAASEARYDALRIRFEKSNLAYLKLLGERDGSDDRPAMLLDAPIGAADDLKKIKGIGPVLEGMLNGLGVYHFHQIAKFTVEDIAWIVARTEAFPDRIIRDRWVEQAADFVTRIERGESI